MSRYVRSSRHVWRALDCMADHLTPAQWSNGRSRGALLGRPCAKRWAVTNHRRGASRRSAHRTQWHFGLVTLATMRSRRRAIYIVADKAKMVDHRDGGLPSDP